MRTSIRTLKAHREQLEAQEALIISTAERRLKPVREELDKVDEKIAELDAVRVAAEIQKYNEKESK